MVLGVTVELDELIALKRFACRGNARPPARLLRGGNYLSRMRGRGMDFAEVRHYQAGDEIRNMEWRVTARTGRPHVKLYQEEKERPVIILNDFNPSMYFGTRQAFKSVTAARLSAVLGWSAIKQGDRIGGLIYSADSHREFNPRSRESALLPFLAALSEYTRNFQTFTTSPRPFSDALLRLRRVVRPGSLLILISDFYHIDAESIKHLRSLRTHNDLIALHICDPLELNPPQPGLYAVSSGSQQLILDTEINKVSAEYQNWCDTRQATLQAMFQSLQCPYSQITGATDPARTAAQIFRRKKV